MGVGGVGGFENTRCLYEARCTRCQIYEVSNIRGVKPAATVDLVMQGSCQFRGADHESGNY